MKNLSADSKTEVMMNFKIFIIIFFSILAISNAVSKEKIIINGNQKSVCYWKKHYVIHDPKMCIIAKFGCPDMRAGTRVFMDKKGCGCEEPVFCDDKKK